MANESSPLSDKRYAKAIVRRRDRDDVVRGAMEVSRIIAEQTAARHADNGTDRLSAMLAFGACTVADAPNGADVSGRAARAFVRTYCDHCAAISECLEYALASHSPRECPGVWGGTLPSERSRILSERQTAQDAQYGTAANPAPVRITKA